MLIRDKKKAEGGCQCVVRVVKSITRRKRFNMKKLIQVITM